MKRQAHSLRQAHTINLAEHEEEELKLIQKQTGKSIMDIFRAGMGIYLKEVPKEALAKVKKLIK